jgi:hypothetical protein
MPRGASEIPDLRLVRLQGLMESFTTSPNLKLMNLFGSQNADSDTIKWETYTGNRGMTPLVAPTDTAPQLSPLGIAQHEAGSAFWKEKMFMDEGWLNNLRQPGTLQTYETAQRKMARELMRMRNRSDRRREWLIAKMLTNNGFSYVKNGGYRATVDYGIPSSNIITLAADRKWDSGVNKNILEDFFDNKLTVQNDLGENLNYLMFPSEILKYFVFDTGLQNLLKKSAYGNGDLLSNPIPVLQSLLKIDNILLYDESFQLTSWLTAAVTGSSTTTVYVDDASDFETGTAYLHDISANTKEAVTISAVDEDAGTVTIAVTTASFKAGEDKLTQVRKFLPLDTITMFCSTVEGVTIAEFINAPFGLDRHYGMKVDRKDEWDPEAVWIRTQNKGLPVLYQADAILNIIVV